MSPESKPTIPPLCMVFDVESIGLHGEGFAVGYVVITPSGEQVGDRIFACHPDRANGGPDGRAWVAENCPPIVFNCASPREVRRFFWAGWQSWKDQGAVLVADCAWPVEARFLAACVDDQPDQNAWNGPYPLHELASFMVAADMDPMATYDRLPDEPQHDPPGDARQSSRLLRMALSRLAAAPTMLEALKAAATQLSFMRSVIQCGEPWTETLTITHADVQARIAAAIAAAAPSETGGDQ